MGVYIKGAKMPKCCTECSLYCYDDRLRNEEERHICLLKCWTRLIRPTEERQYYCPLVEVKTPHGRLVDFGDIKYKGYTEAEIISLFPTVIEEED